jgi:hypothetical protein
VLVATVADGDNGENTGLTVLVVAGVGVPRFTSRFAFCERRLIRSLRASARAAAELLRLRSRIINDKYSARLPYPRSLSRAQTSQRQNSVSMQSGARGSWPVAVR